MKAFLSAFIILASVIISGSAESGANSCSMRGTPADDSVFGLQVCGNHGIGPPPPIGTAPIVDMAAEVWGLDYPNNGVSTGLSGSTTTLTVNPGVWLNSPTSFTYNWHTVNAPGTSLGTGTTLTLNTTTFLGQAIEVDETACGAGCSTQTSHWFGPIENSVPVARTRMELSAIPALGTGSLPTQPVHFLQNGHAVAPGAIIPPQSPPFTSGVHVWYFDPIGGTTQDAGATGHTKATAFNNVQAIFNAGQSGYSGGKLFNRTIIPGDTIYIEPGNISHPLGDINGAAYSTSTGTDTGTINFTWIVPDPTATTQPVLGQVSFLSGTSGFIVKGFGIERYRNGGLVGVSGSESTPSHDILFENNSITQWTGHSSDPWLKPVCSSGGFYPCSGGSSTGDVLSASPTFSGDVEDGTFLNIPSASIHATVINVPTIPPMSTQPYIWSPGQYFTTSLTPTPSGIPPGTMVKAVNGLDSGHFSYSGGAVNAFTASQLTAFTLGGTRTAVSALPQSGSASTTGFYWLVATTGTAAQAVDAWDVNTANIFWATNPIAGDTFTINGHTWTWVASGATGNQVNVGSSETVSINNAVTALTADATMHAIATYVNNGNTTLTMTWIPPGSNFVVSASPATSVSHSWKQLGTIPPAAPTTADLILLETLNNHVLHWAGSSGPWADLGTPTMTIAPCDPTADHATGCPAAFSTASLGLANVHRLRSRTSPMVKAGQHTDWRPNHGHRLLLRRDGNRVERPDAGVLQRERYFHKLHDDHASGLLELR